MPIGIEQLGVDVTYDLNRVVKECDVIMMLRLQFERQRDRFLPSIREYAKKFGLNREKLREAKKNILIMHPGPTNRGIELSADVADGEHSVILDQVTNGVAIRMAILYLLLGTKGDSE
jgi:aspartate carbamoyltransferase catalytic subunit